ncbi:MULTISPECIES: ParB/RepB/Spo0J family partition protein [Xanthomonas]|uniref:ParB/RepB/Spo0J family partition protein n=1 Tax=Xanthomonas citri TaxID=346 RepID=UPI000F80BEC9|nr:ParB/RepB/Spo0J family partition protein [Xanthomonas axonopodis]RTE56195.1 ParB/RepB/Spo0J family partition protein [Xanthomonas axonopodis pv. eucalyptorum]RWU13120.1 ParB/RepB/Spo0J family partition protein [Xanthomonas phaseoli pv. manihotis str. CIO151]
MIDLSALNAKQDDEVTPVSEPDGKPFRIPIADIERDPNQPRTEFSDEEIDDLAENIKDRGVKLPISVKTHPTKPGMWMINDGELRWLASQRAGVADIPAIVDEDFDDFDQVNANEKRYALRPIELAQFIKRKLSDGLKKGVIAKRLGKPANAITELLSLVDAPACVTEAYSSGRCTSPKTLYELRALAEKYPDQVQEWCDSDVEITRASVAALGDSLKEKKAPNPSDPAAGAAGANPDGVGKFRHDEKNGGGGQGAESGESGESGDGGEGGGAGKFRHDEKTPPGNQGEGGGSGAGAGSGDTDTGELTSWPRGKAVSDPDSMKRPLLLVEHDGRAAAVLLNRRPSTAGLIRIRYEDGGGDAEVDAGSLKINRLMEGEK